MSTEVTVNNFPETTEADGPITAEFQHRAYADAEEHIVSFTSLLAPPKITAVCTCGRLNQDCGTNPTHMELTNIASAHLVPGVNA